MTNRFQAWYAEEAQKQVQDKVPVDQVKVDMPASIVNYKSANWMISSWQTLQQRPGLALVLKAGTLHAVNFCYCLTGHAGHFVIKSLCWSYYQTAWQELHGRKKS